MGLVNVPIKEGVNSPRIYTARGTYDFTVEGGAVSTIGLMGATLLPAGITIIGGYVDVQTQVTGAGASIACQVEAANDILTAVAIASWTTGRKNILPQLGAGALTASTVVRTTAARDISIVISAAVVTAGRFHVVLFYNAALA